MRLLWHKPLHVDVTLLLPFQHVAVTLVLLPFQHADAKRLVEPANRVAVWEVAVIGPEPLDRS